MRVSCAIQLLEWSPNLRRASFTRVLECDALGHELAAGAAAVLSSGILNQVEARIDAPWPSLTTDAP